MPLYLENLNMDFFKESEDVMGSLFGMTASEGKAKIGYYNYPYFNKHFGNAQIILRTGYREPGDEDDRRCIQAEGIDTHISGRCVWEVRLHNMNVDRKDADLLAKRVAVTRMDGGGMAIVNLVNADVLPSFMGNDIIKMQMVAFPDLIEYYKDEDDYAEHQPEGKTGKKFLIGEGSVIPTGILRNRDPNSSEYETDDNLDDLTAIRGVVKGLYWGELEFEGERYKSFVKCIIDTDMGELEIVHTIDQVEEEMHDNMKVGSTVVMYGTLSGDVAIYEYSEGIVKDEEHHLSLVRYTFTDGDPQRFCRVIADNARYVSEYSKQTFVGKKDIMDRLQYVNDKNSGRKIYAYKATITSVDEGEGELPYGVGKRCVVLAYDEPNDYGGIVFLEMNEEGNITDIVVSINPRYHFKLDEEFKPKSIFDGWEIPDTVAVPITTRAKFHGFLGEDVYAENVASIDENYIEYKNNINNFLDKLDVDIEEIEPSILENIFAYLFAKAIESKCSTTLYKNAPEHFAKIVSYSIEEGLNGGISIDIENETVKQKIKIAYDYGKQFYKDYMIFAMSDPENDMRVILEQSLMIVQQIGEKYALDQLVNLIE